MGLEGVAVALSQHSSFLQVHTCCQLLYFTLVSRGRGGEGHEGGVMMGRGGRGMKEE